MNYTYNYALIIINQLNTFCFCTYVAILHHRITNRFLLVIEVQLHFLNKKIKLISGMLYGEICAKLYGFFRTY